ncbi:MAG: Gfo/Idh/MocA family protein, partial [Acidimicrobiia bacterium]
MGNTLGWGVIGLGNIVRSTIAPAMVAEPACDLVAAVSRDQGRADAFTREFGARHGYSDYDEMLANSDVEAVFIATPNVFHPEQVVAAAGAGKHVLCDKPLAITAADAKRALEACADAGVKLGINFHNRHLPWVRDVSRLIGEGIIGEVKMVQLQVASGPRHYDNWRSDPEIAGLGSVHNVGVHGLDFLRVLLDSDPVEVMAMFDNDAESGEVEMLALLQLRFANGA